MSFKRVTAIISEHMLERVERRLRELNVPGMTVSEVKGYGSHKNFYHVDWMDACARLQIYIMEERADEIVNEIMETAHTGIGDDGIIVVSPVDKIYRIFDKSEIIQESS